MNKLVGEVCSTCVCAIFSLISIHKAQHYVLAICLTPDIHIFQSCHHLCFPPIDESRPIYSVLKSKRGLNSLRRWCCRMALSSSLYQFHQIKQTSFPKVVKG